MHLIQQSFQVNYSYPVYFSEGIFHLKNDVLKKCFENKYDFNTKILFVVDTNFYSKNKNITNQIKEYFNYHLPEIKIIDHFIEIEGGEAAKNDSNIVNLILDKVHTCAIDRHSYICVMGGGSVIDVVGFAAAIAHRGIRLIRIPTTTLAQNDAAIGVKNSVNTYGKKNFTGTFAPPFAVINDFNFLKSLNDRDWRCGIAEAIKVALIKDLGFFYWIQKNTKLLFFRDMISMKSLIIRCADLHLKHIASGDAFEQGSARPLDFGHWAAHKLEYISNFKLKHGEAVAIGIALDSTYSYLNNYITKNDICDILDTIMKVGFNIYTLELLQKDADNNYIIINGLEEFREHLGGKLTITLLEKMGQGKEVNTIDKNLLLNSIEFLKNFQK